MGAGRKNSRIFATDGMRTLSSLAAIGRWQDSMAVLALLLAARDAGLSLSMATLCTAAMAVAAGLSSTPKARLIDRYGMRVPVSSLAIATSAAYLLLLLALLTSGPYLVLGAALLLGASRTNSGMCMQLTWMSALRGEEMRAKAVSWEGLINSVMQNTGPLLVSALVAVYSPLAALAFCGLATSLSMWLWARHSFHITAQAKLRHRRNRLHIGGGVLVIALVAMGLNMLLGGLQVMLVSGSGPSSAAILNGALAAGAAAASVYAMKRGFPMLSKLPLLLLGGLLSVGLLLALSTSAGLLLMIPMLLLGGVLYGLGNSSITLMLQRRAPEGRRAEAFAWRLTLCFIGLGLGQAGAGQMIDLLGRESAGLTLAAIALVFAAASSIALIRPQPASDNLATA